MSGFSQAEARRLRKRVRVLENILDKQRASWQSEWPGGSCLGSYTLDRTWLIGRIEAARMLGHAVVVTENNDGKLMFYALPQARPA